MAVEAVEKFRQERDLRQGMGLVFNVQHPVTPAPDLETYRAQLEEREQLWSKAMARLLEVLDSDNLEGVTPEQIVNPPQEEATFEQSQ